MSLVLCLYYYLYGAKRTARQVLVVLDAADLAGVHGQNVDLLAVRCVERAHGVVRARQVLLPCQKLMSQPAGRKHELAGGPWTVTMAFLQAFPCANIREYSP